MDTDVIVNNAYVLAALVGGCLAALASIIGSVTLVVVQIKKFKQAVAALKEKTVVEEQLKREKELRLKAEAKAKRLEEQNDLLLEKCLKVKQDRSR